MVSLQRSIFGGGEPALDGAASTERVDFDEHSWVDVVRGWLLGADTLFDALAASVPWRHGRRWMYERVVDEPRLTRAYAPDEALPHPALGDVRSALEQRYGTVFGGVFLNYYRDGRDSVAFHRDPRAARVGSGPRRDRDARRDPRVPVPATLGRPFHRRSTRLGRPHRDARAVPPRLGARCPQDRERGTTDQREHSIPGKHLGAAEALDGQPVTAASSGSPVTTTGHGALRTT